MTEMKANGTRGPNGEMVLSAEEYRAVLELIRAAHNCTSERGLTYSFWVREAADHLERLLKLEGRLT